MAASTRNSDAYRHVLEDHVEVRVLLASIDDALDERRDADEVCRLLAQLGDKLVHHFALEEDGGYFSDALLQSPRLVARANGLMAQHPMLSERARKLLDETHANPGTDTWWAETREQFDAFRDTLVKHEQGEDRLLQEAYTQDIGSHD